MDLNHRKLREKLNSLFEKQELNEKDLLLIFVGLNDESLDDERVELIKKLETLRENRILEQDEFDYIKKTLTYSLVPWFSILSVLFGSFSLILLDSGSPALSSIFKLSEMIAFVGVIFASIALSRRERQKSISVIGLLLSLLVLLIDNTILFGL